MRAFLLTQTAANTIGSGGTGILFVIYIVVFEAVYNYFAKKGKTAPAPEEKEKATV